MQVLTPDYWSSFIKPVIADLGVALVFGVGYHLFKKLKSRCAAKMTSKTADSIFATLGKLGITVRGMYGEGTKSVGNIF